LFQSSDPQKVRDVVATIEMEDAKPTRVDGQDVWTGSGLTFGIPDCIITFYQHDKKILEYGLEASPTTITPTGPRANYGPDIPVALPLTTKSAAALQSMITRLEKTPNQSPDPALASGTPGAEHQSRHP
jgi:hypothetical protein